ncbi:hypothetical protein [Roseiflexus sp.]|uniref:hypothetical protein n=1 Tax=Roseiflexus TaxID=120961 RepID=UPI0021DCD75E|nr:hypothetical protein [Roseiflexus sp.]GIW00990.1 MAG: hypothetical protein KatS3mg058_2393 [Roseiflexus sp.]
MHDATHAPGAEPPLFLATSAADESLAAQIERAIHERRLAVVDLPLLTDVAQGDPYLADQLAALHAQWEVRPQPSRGLLDRLRRRIAWWLLEPEIRQINAVHATLTRLIDSLIVLADRERAARRRIEEYQAHTSAEPPPINDTNDG